VANALREGPRTLPANLDKSGIARDLIERWQSALRFRQQFVIQVRFEL
jgi:hypothetical protein